MILLTGFEPFTTGQGLVLTENPTADIVKGVASRWPAAAPDLVAEVLPVSYLRTRQALNQSLAQYAPQVWIGLGFAPHRTSLDIEVVALNLEHAVRGDNDGDQPWLRTLAVDGPLAYQTRLDVAHAVQVFQTHGVDAKASTHAGTFLCNQVFYLGCHACEAGPLDLAAFIHVPPMDDYMAVEMGLASLLAGLRTLAQ